MVRLASAGRLHPCDPERAAEHFLALLRGSLEPCSGSAPAVLPPPSCTAAEVGTVERGVTTPCCPRGVSSARRAGSIRLMSRCVDLRNRVAARRACLPLRRWGLTPAQLSAAFARDVVRFAESGTA
ncbi:MULTISPECIES: TetR/AcrR family transcriptional regulator C-terminal domain-containing protein [Streptomyces]|uniref:TetR/AcrR family transcriptional regulator C-terminal domain-containing protein n=1 Tax=Streptomyces TaxID=1883 RepID=UPI00345C4A7A